MDLRGNDLLDDDALLLAITLQFNTNLSILHLNDNIITAFERSALLEAVFDVSSLNSCAGSNHTCQIDGLNLDISAINIFEKSAENRAMKLFTVLSETTDNGFFNLNCLSEISNKLIPMC